MRSLKQRLQAIKGSPPTGSDADLVDLIQRIERLRAGRRCPAEAERIDGDAELARRLGAEWVSEGLLVLDKTLEADQCHGAYPVRPPESGLYTDTGDWLLLDTETTGLAGGSGTLAFLVGVARFNAGRLTLRQYLMTRFSAETAMLQRLCADLTGNETLISYNGKSYDLPLLATRLRLHGLDNPLAGLRHLDLLHAVRRRHREHWENCRLVTAERELLRFERRHDLPGSLAPKAWLSYVRAGRWEPLDGVLRHNRLDLISLAVLPEALEREPLPLPTVQAGPVAPALSARERLRNLRRTLDAAAG